jgi:hypothetical protein
MEERGNEITFIISDFLERIASLTRDELVKPSCRIIWMDHIERLKKDEGVYWFIKYKDDFVFDLASTEGSFHLIRNYRSTDNNIALIDLSQVPNVPCIIEVAWDVDFIELTINVGDNVLPGNKKGFKSRAKTDRWNPPIELLKWINQKNQNKYKYYLNEEDFRIRLVEIIKGLQRKLDTFSTFGEFWDFKKNETLKVIPIPKSEKDIVSSLIENISENLELSGIRYSYVEKPKPGTVNVTFSAKIKNKGIFTITLEIVNAHSDDIINEISKVFPYFVKSQNSKYGIFLVLWFKGEQYAFPEYDTEVELALTMQKSLNQANHDKSIFNNNITISILNLSPDTRNIGHLNVANCSQLSFQNLEKKLIATYNNKKIIFGTFLMLLKRNKDLSEKQKLRLGKDNLREYCKQNQLPFPIIKKIYPVYTKDIINNYTPFYKYVVPEVFEKLKNGCWQLGTIEQYRTIEYKKQRDEFEGFSFFYLDINNHFVGSSFISGFNYLILCGTTTPDSKYHKEIFGEKCIFFPNVKTLAEKICSLINAKKYYIQNVEYNSLKFYISREKIYNEHFRFENLLSPPYFDIINDHLLYPSIFVKPENFKPENEVRLVFEMEQDHSSPVKFQNKELNNYVKFLD